MKRKTISKRIRFSIFARDGFSCKYCGRQSDEVKLVIDHITPVAKGGTNDETNLITSCEPCNQGKAAKLLPSEPQIESRRLCLAQEFQEQNSLHRAAVEAARIKTELRQEICNSYCEIMGVSELKKSTLSHYVSLCERFGYDLLFEWLKIVSQKGTIYRDVEILKYIHGIKSRYLEQNGGIE